MNLRRSPPLEDGLEQFYAPEGVAGVGYSAVVRGSDSSGDSTTAEQSGATGRAAQELFLAYRDQPAPLVSISALGAKARSPVVRHVS